MPFTTSLAAPSDAAAIAHVFQSNETDSFLRLQLGTVDPEVMTEGLTERLAENISKPDTVYVVARDDGTGEIMSFASWTLPRGRDEEFVRQSDDEKAAAAEGYRAKLLPGMNEPLLMDFRQGIEEMRARALSDRRYYMLGNLVTLPTYKRQGAGSALTSWPFEKVDKEGVLVYLDTDQDGAARGMYERLGFEKVDEVSFDLSRYGGSGVHTHIGMVREPRARS